MNFLKSKYVRALTVALVLQGSAYYAIASRAENLPNVAPLSLFPTAFGGWTTRQDIPVEKEILDILKADDTLNRQYVNPVKGQVVDLFITFFKTQRSGQAPHSPKNCLPGAGWEPIIADKASLRVPGLAEPIVVNRYVVENGENKSVVLYWYQSHSRIIANEYSAKFWLVADSIRYHRSDTAMVRIIVPVRENRIDSATGIAYSFAQALFPSLEAQLPR